MSIIFIVGPTAVGKTKLSIALAKAFNGEIISGDAMQFYQGLDIGTAKASLQEQQEVPHHLLSFLDPRDHFSVAHYQQMVRSKIDELMTQKKTPIIVGGSGLYVQSIIKDYRFLGKQRTNSYDDLPLESLQMMLKEKNPISYQRIDLANKRRVIRALEKSDEDFQDKPQDYYQDYHIIGLEMERVHLYQRINQRVETMIDEGLIDEVKILYHQGVHSQAIQAIGYKELYRYFEQEISLDEAVALIQRNSRRYAKRQMTWFKNQMNVRWFKSLDDFQQTIENVIDFIKKSHQ